MATIRRFTTFVVAGGLMAFTASPALAQTAPPPGGRRVPAPTNSSTAVPRGVRIDRAKQRADEAIRRRLRKLSELTAHVNGSKTLTGDHRAALLAHIDAAERGLTDLASTITAETDPAELGPDIDSIVQDYHVYVLLTPKVNAVIAADAELAAARKLESVAGEIDAKITSLSGNDTSAAAGALATMRTAIDSARGHAGGVADNVLPLVTTGYPANKSTLEAAHTSLRQGRDDLRSARRSGKAALDALRALGT